MRASKAREYRPRCATTATRNHAESWGSMNKPGSQARAQEEHFCSVDERRRTSSVVPDASSWCPKSSSLHEILSSSILGCRGFAVPTAPLGNARRYLPSPPGANRARNFARRSATRLCGGASSGRVFAGNDPSRASDDTGRSAAREERHSSRAAELLSFALRAAAAPGRRHSRGPLHWRCARWPSVHPVAT